MGPSLFLSGKVQMYQTNQNLKKGGNLTTGITYLSCGVCSSLLENCSEKWILFLKGEPLNSSPTTEYEFGIILEKKPT